MHGIIMLGVGIRAEGREASKMPFAWIRVLARVANSGRGMPLGPPCRLAVITGVPVEGDLIRVAPDAADGSASPRESAPERTAEWLSATILPT